MDALPPGRDKKTVPVVPSPAPAHCPVPATLYGDAESPGGPDALWWETACEEFWQEPRKKILFPARFRRPVFLFDPGRGIGDEATIAIPSAGLYLAGVLNSRLMGFVFNRTARQSAPDREIFLMG